jgi:hypothetical protein
MPRFIGKSIPRLEDERFVTGRGRYTNDIPPPDACWAYVLRSPHAHARSMRSIAAARAHPGVGGRPAMPHGTASALKIFWDKRAETIVNNGHTIQVDIGDSSILSLGTTNYRLLQFHFHRPSEHLIGGKSFAMEAHFVHANVANSLAVIGVLMTAGKANAVFTKLVSTMPDKEGPPVNADPAIDPNSLLPAKRDYIRYSDR